MSPLERLMTKIRTTSFGPQLSIALWIVFAFAVWNVVFDRVLVLAGRSRLVRNGIQRGWAGFNHWLDAV